MLLTVTALAMHHNARLFRERKEVFFEIGEYSLFFIKQRDLHDAATREPSYILQTTELVVSDLENKLRNKKKRYKGGRLLDT
jgi:hypothetical protein